MRILYVNDLLIGGGAELILNSLRERLNRRGHDIYFAYAEPAVARSESRIEVPRNPLLGKSIIYMNIFDHVVYDATRNLLDLVEPDLVHLNNLMLLGLAPLFAARKKRVPCILTLHDYWPVCPRRNLLLPTGVQCQTQTWSTCFRCAAAAHPSDLVRTFAQFLFPPLAMMLKRRLEEIRDALRNTAIVCPSRFSMDVLSRFGYSSAKLHLIPHGIDTSEVKGCKNPSPLFLWAARLERPKGLEFFVEVARVIRKIVPDARFRICGRKASEAMYGYDELPSLDQLEFLGEVSHNEILRMYYDALAVVVTSIEPETFSMVALEAMACSTPVVSFDSGALREIIVDGETGFLVPRGDCALLAQRVLTLLKDRALGLEMGRRARERVERFFSLETMVNKYERLYKTVIQQSSAR